MVTWPTGTRVHQMQFPAVGGAMDLAVGAKKVFITTDHRDQTR